MKYNKNKHKSYKDNNYNKLIDKALDNKNITVTPELIDKTMSRIRKNEPEYQDKKRPNRYIFRVIATAAVLVLVITSSIKINNSNKYMKSDLATNDRLVQPMESDSSDEEYSDNITSYEKEFSGIIQDDKLEEINNGLNEEDLQVNIRRVDLQEIIIDKNDINVITINDINKNEIITIKDNMAYDFLEEICELRYFYGNYDDGEILYNLYLTNMNSIKDEDNINIYDNGLITVESLRSEDSSLTRFILEDHNKIIDIIYKYINQ